MIAQEISRNACTGFDILQTVNLAPEGMSPHTVKALTTFTAVCLSRNLD
jgi:hypothetical protein